jgi:hypothetical protein
MDSKRLLAGTLAGAVTISVVGYLLYEVIFASFLDAQMTVVPREAPIWWAAVLSALAHALLLTLVIAWAGDSSAAGGLKTAAIIGFLLWFGSDMILFGVFEFTTLVGAATDSVLATVQYGLAGAAIGALSGKGAHAISESAVGGGTAAG